MPFIHDLDKVFLPPASDVPPSLRKLAGEHDRLSAAAATAAAEHRKAEQAVPDAQAADQRLYADALRSKKADPGTPNLDRAKGAVEQAKRHAAAAQLAAEGAASDLKAAIVAGRGAWLDQLETEQAERRRDLAAAVDRLAEARSAVANVDATTAWLAGFPSRRGPRGGEPPVRGLVGANGSPAGWAAVVDALRAEAAPPLEPAA